MALDLLAIISAAGTGAVTGYLTNNLALKMIFKEYGPLGGVVIKTKDEFIDSISALVERDLINHHTLKEEFSGKEFKNNFNQSVEEFLNIYLENRSSDLRLGEIPGWEENFNLLSSAASDSAVEIIMVGSEELTDKNLNLLISETQQEELFKKVFEKIVNKAKKEDLVENLVLNIHSQLKSKSLKQLLDDEVQLQLKDLVKEITEYFKMNQQRMDVVKKEKVKKRLKEVFNLEKLSQKILIEVKELRLSDLIKETQELEQMIKEADLRKIIKDIFINFKIEIDNSDLLLDDFFTEKMELELKKDLSELIYSSENKLLNFLKSEEAELDNLILGSVEEEIEASTGFKAMSRQGIYNKYQENIEEYGSPMTHLKSYLKEQLRSDNKELAAKLLLKLKKVKINKILPEIDLNLISENIEAALLNFYQQYEDYKLIDLFTEEIFAKKMITDKIVDLLFSLLENISSDPDSIDILFDYLMELNLEDLLNQEKISRVKDELTDKEYRLFSEETPFLQEAVDYFNHNFFSLLNGEIKNSRFELKDKINNYLKQLQVNFADRKIKSFYNIIRDNPEAVAGLTESITSFFYNNLPELLEGKVAQAASANLHQLSDQEVQTAIEDFMGQELKPITYLGALLGAAAGIIFSLSGAETVLFSNSPLWVDYLSSAVLYGGVGWLTNVLAIWMIFNPYQEKYILGAKIPFTPGVVAKNRSRFANSMGKFVEKELLKANTASELIETNRSEIKNRTLEYFKNSDYQQFFEFLSEKKEILAQSSLKQLEQFIADFEVENFDAFVQTIDQSLNKVLTKKVQSFDFRATAEKYISQEAEHSQKISDQLGAALSREHITAAAAGEYSFELKSKQLKSLLQNKELYPLFKFLAPYLLEAEIKFDLKDYLVEILENDSDYYLDQSLNFLYEQQGNISRLINFKKDEIIENEKEKKGGLLKNTMISGAIYMADLDEFVNSVVKRVFNKLESEYFVDKRNELEDIYHNLLAELETKKLMAEDSLRLNQILKGFIVTDKGSEVLTEVLSLSEDSIVELIDLIFKEENTKLMALNFDIKSEAVEYLINQNLNLEQKLKLLLSVKELFKADNIKNEILQLLENVDLTVLNQELEQLLKGMQLIDPKALDQQLVAEIRSNLASVLKRQEINELFINKSAEEISELAVLLEQKMDRESLEYLLALFVEAGVDSFKANAEALLQSLELKELTASEVRKMNPAEIEEIFDSFAGKYFAHLKQYGWFGGIFGVLQLLLRSIL